MTEIPSQPMLVKKPLRLHHKILLAAVMTVLMIAGTPLYGMWYFRAFITSGQVEFVMLLAIVSLSIPVFSFSLIILLFVKTWAQIWKRKWLWAISAFLSGSIIFAVVDLF